MTDHKPVPHDYLSTACHHGLHDKCRKVCKYCEPETPCRCACHTTSGVYVPQDSSIPRQRTA